MPVETVLVTGGTGGIGLHIAEGLARRGARVLVTGRDHGRGQAALEGLRQVANDGAHEFLPADHATVGGNQRLAEDVSARVDRLDVLVNNVGGLPPGRQETSDGYEANLALNAVGPFALTTALLPLLRAAGRSRVVNVVSSAHAMWRGDPFEDLQSKRRYVGIEAHARAKLLAVMWTLALPRSTLGRHLTASAVNPGGAWTPGTRSLTRDAVPAWRYVWPIVRLFQRMGSPLKAARAPILLATGEIGGAGGGYFESNARPVAPSAAARDEASQDCAWTLLGDLVRQAPTRRPHP